MGRLVSIVLLLTVIACGESAVPSAEGASLTGESSHAILPHHLSEAASARWTATDEYLARHLGHPEMRWDLGLRWTSLLTEVYTPTKPSPHFVNSAGLTPKGERVLAALRASRDHGLEPDIFHVDELAKRLEKWSRLRASGELTSVSLTSQEQGKLIAWLLRTRPEDMDAVLDTVLGPSSPVPGLAARWSVQDAKRRRAARLLAELELLIADGLMHYSYVMRHHNMAYVPPLVRRTRGDERVVREAVSRTFQDALGGQVDTTLASLEPSFPQYRLLMDALAQYRTIAEGGDWGEIRPRRLPIRVGARGDVVKQLQERLRTEGYYLGPITGRFDGRVRRAVEAYQRTHQLRDDGVVDEDEIASLNRSVDERVAQIEVALERWRSNRIAHDTYYVHVNLPDFHGEVWRDGVRQHRFRAIIGNQARANVDGRGDPVYPNATPLISDSIDFVIFDPAWNVPPRIIRELDRNLAKDPRWYEKHGFDVRTDGGVRKVRQRPGAKNALGRVKFQFPNAFDVYLHDSPNRRLFNHAVRAFSHGCVRVEDPTELAFWLLKNDGRSNPRARIADYLARPDEDWSQLDTPVAVHLEYYTVRVDEDGRVHFLADVYGYDRPFVDARLRGERRLILGG